MAGRNAGKLKAKLVPLAQFNGKILLDPSTGQIHHSGAAVRLQVPVLVVRHGETDGNLRKVLQGQVDGPENQLNQRGRAQARQAGLNVLTELERRLGRKKLIHLTRARKLVALTSPIRRARQTCDYFVRELNSRLRVGVEVREEEALEEISFGRYDGSAVEEIPDKTYAQLVKRYRSLQDATIDWLQTGESFIDTVVRSRNFIERINEKHRNELLIMFTHGTLISALRTALGDRALASESGMIQFRDRIIENASPHWLADSIALLKRL